MLNKLMFLQRSDLIDAYIEGKRRKDKRKKDDKKDEVDISQFITGEFNDNEDDNRHGKKKNKKQNKKNKNKNKQQDQDDNQEEQDEQNHDNDEEKVGIGENDKDDEETKGETNNEEAKGEVNDNEEVKDEPDEASVFEQIEVLYCNSCTFPYEYWAFVSSDLDACKENLKKENPSLYGIVYEGREEEANEENKGKKKKNKNIVKKKEFSKDTEIKIMKQKRSGKKMVTTIHGLDGFDLNLKDFSKKLGKKFAWGNAIIKDGNTGEQIVQLLGDIDQDEFFNALDSDFPDVAKAKFVFVDGGNKKGRKKK